MTAFEINSDTAANPQSWGDDLIQAHRLNKLQEIATEYNSTAPVELKINLEHHETIEKIIFALWMRGVSIPNVLTFGEPYDNVLRVWSYIDMADIRASDGIDDLKHCQSYQLWCYPKEVSLFLYFSLMLPPKDYYNFGWSYREYTDKLARFNQIWSELPIARDHPINSYQDLRALLKSNVLSALDLAYLAIAVSCQGLTQSYQNRLLINELLEYVGSDPIRIINPQL
jgi:hypothetical protein